MPIRNNAEQGINQGEDEQNPNQQTIYGVPKSLWDTLTLNQQYGFIEIDALARGAIEAVFLKELELKDKN